jgi:hypothetical protein
MTTRGGDPRPSVTPVLAAEMARLMGARKVFGYAAGGVPWMPTTYSDEGDHADLAALLVEDAEGVQPLDLPLGATYEL